MSPEKNDKLARRCGTKRVLLVDDLPEYRRLLERRLSSRSGIEVVEAGSALAALTLLEELIFDVVVTDLRMPGLSGVELLELVGRRWPDTRRILLTAYSDGALVAEHSYPVLDKTLSARHIADVIVRLARSK